MKVGYCSVGGTKPAPACIDNHRALSGGAVMVN